MASEREVRACVGSSPDQEWSPGRSLPLKLKALSDERKIKSVDIFGLRWSWPLTSCVPAIAIKRLWTAKLARLVTGGDNWVGEALCHDEPAAWQRRGSHGGRRRSDQARYFSSQIRDARRVSHERHENTFTLPKPSLQQTTYDHLFIVLYTGWAKKPDCFFESLKLPYMLT